MNQVTTYFIHGHQVSQIEYMVRRMDIYDVSLIAACMFMAFCIIHLSLHK